MANFDMDEIKLASIPAADRLDAVLLWVHAASWAWGQRTGGWVPLSLVDEWGNASAAAAALVKAGLWAPISVDEDGYLFIDTWVCG